MPPRPKTSRSSTDRAPLLVGTPRSERLSNEDEISERFDALLQFVDEDSPPPEEAVVVKLKEPYYACPSCSAPMRLKTNSMSGGRFFGCARFPECRTSRDASEDQEPVPLASNFGVAASMPKRIVPPGCGPETMWDMLMADD